MIFKELNIDLTRCSVSGSLPWGAFPAMGRAKLTGTTYTFSNDKT